MRFFKHSWRVLLVAGLLASAARAQEVPAVKAQDLKARPQQYWAAFFVFSDVLKEGPAGPPRQIGDAKVVRFKTDVLGKAYVEEAALPVLRDLSPGEEYLFYATVTQEKPALWGWWPGGRDFVVIVKDVAMIKRETGELPGRLVWSGGEAPADRISQPLAQLDQIIKDVHKDVFGFAQTQGIPLSDAFTMDEHRDKVVASVRSALRRFEDRNRITSQEFFVNVISSLIAYQYGYAGAEPTGYVPAKLEDETAPEAFVEEQINRVVEEIIEAAPSLDSSPPR